MDLQKINKFLGPDADDSMSVETAQLWFANKGEELIFEITLDGVGSWVIKEKQMEDLMRLLKKFEVDVL